MLDIKKINKPYHFISELYRRLSGYYSDIENLDPTSSQTRSFVKAVLDWMEAYKDTPDTDTEVRISRHVKVSYYDVNIHSSRCVWDHKPICTVPMIYRNGYIGIGYAFCHPKKDKFDRKVGIELSTERANKMIEEKLCPVDKLTSVDRWSPEWWLDKDRLPYWINNSDIGGSTRAALITNIHVLLEDFFFELTRVLAKQDLEINGDVQVSTD